MPLFKGRNIQNKCGCEKYQEKINLREKFIWGKVTKFCFGVKILIWAVIMAGIEGAGVKFGPTN